MPKLSVVFTARNDNYGGNLINRINTAMNVLAGITEELKFPVELVIVDYNPPPDAESLSAALTLPRHTYLHVRVVTVPSRFHRKISKGSAVPFLEYVAKNIGIRRATGTFVLSTNQDIILSRELLSYIQSSPINRREFYRVNRHDITLREFDGHVLPDEVLSLCRTHIYCVWLPAHKRYRGISIRTVMAFAKDTVYELLINLRIAKTDRSLLFRDRRFGLHEPAAGDFLMMHKSMWLVTRGYDEMGIDTFIDSIMLHKTRAMGYSQRILPYPIYHMAHENDRKNRPESNLMDYYRHCVEMDAEKKPYRINDSNWGYPKEKFGEIIL